MSRDQPRILTEDRDAPVFRILFVFGSRGGDRGIFNQVALDICVYNRVKAAALRGRILVNGSTTFKAEVQFDKKDMARNIIYSSHRCMLDSIFCGKTEGIESDTPE